MIRNVMLSEWCEIHKRDQEKIDQMNVASDIKYTSEIGRRSVM